jgi:hypothetical protein
MMVGQINRFQMEKFISITIDVDTVSTLFPASGHSGLEDTSFTAGLERFLKLFKKYGVQATFFLVGKDLEDEKNGAIVKEIASEGHEIANHTMNHIQSFHKLPDQKIIEEIAKTEKIIHDTTGVKVKGFRAPGWNTDRRVLEILSERNYLYDTSVFPTSIMPLAKLIHYRKTKNLPPLRRSTMGSIKNMFASRNIYEPKLNKKKSGTDGILEFPVTTVPVFRVPFFGTMIFEIGMPYITAFYRFVKTQKMINFSLHLAELCDKNSDFDIAILSKDINKGYVPKCLHVGIAEKIKMFETLFGKFRNDFTFITMKDAVKFYRSNRTYY